MSGATALTVWFLLGAIIGVVWTNVSPTRSAQSGFANVAVGGTGAMLGGALTLWAFGGAGAERVVFSFPVAFTFAAVSLLAFKAIAGRRRGGAAA
jgi:uncharacterized membrane protein YeaQ/YmgE (transglycosylase-associated protein family)